MRQVAIIGGGIIGLAIGYELSKHHTKYKISLFEKEKNLGKHQSGNNSGVLHCGLHYLPGSLKAKLAVDGIKRMISYCEENNINHDICGKIVVPTNEKELILLDDLAARGFSNGLNGLKFITKSEIQKREPHLNSKKALLVPEEGIVNYNEVIVSLSEKIKNKGGDIFLDNKVLGIFNQKFNKTVIKTQNLEKEFDVIINCTGLFSDRVYSSFTKKKSPIKIIPFRGEYMQMSEEYKHIVNHLIYPVPNPEYPFLGVHFTRTINGTREVGPNAVFALKREGYKNSDISLYDIIDSLSYKGLINFFLNNTRFAIDEIASSLSSKLFITKAKKLIPDIEEYMFIKGGTAGVRAQAISSSGELIMDFNIIREKNQVHILNAPSPGATASLSIAKHIVDNYIL